MSTIDKYRGCLIGGAAGDALGYAVEFSREEQIAARYGAGGIRDYQLDDRGLAPFSDDTQMTLYTANGLLHALTRGRLRGILGPLRDYVSGFYVEWSRTQTEPYPLADHSAWISALPELFVPRAPGATCLSACAVGAHGTPEEPINDSKGCGGIMRVAPAGLLAGPRGADGAAAQRLGAQLAALTHGHELGWLPAGVFAHIVSALAHGEADSVRGAAEQALTVLPEAHPGARRVGELQELMRFTLRLADGTAPDVEAIHQLGEGWVAEEALAIALLCALRHEDDFEGTAVSAVNHSGDSDSTGAIAGNIVGARLGLAGIPRRYVERLELADVVLALADDLFTGCPITEYCPSADGVWEHKYLPPADYVEWERGR